MSQLQALHFQSTMRSGSYDERKQRRQAYRAYADALAARLPFKWHSVACDNPTQNHTGATNGQNHIVLAEAFTSGRLRRKTGDALCRPVGRSWGDNLWNEVDGPTCKRCLELAARLVGEEE